jgi:hypothetical protein
MVARTPTNNASRTLVDQLATRLRGGLSLDEPFIIEDRVPQTHSRHVVVIWDAWKSLGREDRSRIILDAYRSSNGLRGDTVRVALGLTQQEAFDMGYLPFGIVTTVRKTDRVALNDVRKALDSVGGIHIKVGSSRQVRFPSLEHAEEAHRQLSAKIPGPVWAITQEVAAIGRV